MATINKKLFTAGADCCIKVWDLENLQRGCIKTIQGHSKSVWEAKTLVQKQTIPGLHHWVRSLALNPERDKLYSGSHNTIDIWSVTEPFDLKGKWTTSLDPFTPLP